MPLPASPRDLRCPCGALLARRVAAGVELRCRRCHRTAIIPLSQLGEAPLVLSFAEAPLPRK